MIRHTGEDLIDVERVAVASVLSFQTTGINRAEFDAPETYRLAIDCDATFSEEIFDVAVTEIESVVKPDGVGNDIWRESVAFVCIHPLVLSGQAL
jgi:hypothetical protein